MYLRPTFNFHLHCTIPFLIIRIRFTVLNSNSNAACLPCSHLCIGCRTKFSTIHTLRHIWKYHKGDLMQKRQPSNPISLRPLTSLGCGSEITKITYYLQDNDRVGDFHDKACMYPRFVHLHCQNIFNSLVKIYEGLFLRYYSHFQDLLKGVAFNNTGSQSHIEYAAKVYVSAWFIDLYVSNREAVKKLSNSAYNDLLRGEEQVHVLKAYDPFLSALNAVIRPTRILMATEDTIYIPIIHAHPDWSTDNPFGITGFLKNFSLLQDMVGAFNEMKIRRTTPLGSHTLGRPTWLLDWHDHRAYIWFPMEGNCQAEDISLAYILGVSCTPLLGHRDIDEWQDCPVNVVPDNKSTIGYERVTPQQFFGSCEVRKVETGTQQWPLQADSGSSGPSQGALREETTCLSKRLRIGDSYADMNMKQDGHGDAKEGMQTEEATLTSVRGAAVQQQAKSALRNQHWMLHRFRIVDYVYYSCVIQKWDEYTQSTAFNGLVCLE